MAKQKLKATKPEVSVKGVLAQRGPKYGKLKFIDQASVSQSLKHVMFATPNWSKLAADQREALEMVAMKISRVLVGDPNYLDGYRDISGYMSLVVDRLAITEGSTDAKVIPQRFTDGAWREVR